jgi:hypothetical protein
MRPLLGVEFAIAFEIDIRLHCAERDYVPNLGPNTHDPRLETADPVASATVATDLIVNVANYPNLELLGQKLRRAPVEMHINATLILGRWIDKIVGEA